MNRKKSENVLRVKMLLNVMAGVKCCHWPVEGYKPKDIYWEGNTVLI
jgi:hypothetical protein